MKAIQALKAALAHATPDWFVVPAKDASNFGHEHIEVHDGYGRTATVYGEAGDVEALANATLMALAQNHMDDLIGAAQALKVVRDSYLQWAHGDDTDDAGLLAVLQTVFKGNDVSALMDRLAAGEKAPETNGPVEVFAGYFGYEGTVLHADFQVPVGATIAEKDSAFMAALAQQADIDYRAVGESDKPLGA